MFSSVYLLSVITLTAGACTPKIPIIEIAKSMYIADADSIAYAFLSIRVPRLMSLHPCNTVINPNRSTRVGIVEVFNNTLCCSIAAFAVGVRENDNKLAG